MKCLLSRRPQTDKAPKPNISSCPPFFLPLPSSSRNPSKAPPAWATPCRRPTAPRPASRSRRPCRVRAPRSRARTPPTRPLRPRTPPQRSLWSRLTRVGASLEVSPLAAPLHLPSFFSCAQPCLVQLRPPLQGCRHRERAQPGLAAGPGSWAAVVGIPRPRSAHRFAPCRFHLLSNTAQLPSPHLLAQMRSKRPAALWSERTRHCRQRARRPRAPCTLQWIPPRGARRVCGRGGSSGQ